MMPMSRLSRLYEELEEITSHKQIVDTLAEFFKKLEPEEAKIAAYFALGSTGPKFKNTDMGMGNKFCLQSVAKAYNVKKDEVQKIFDEKGDLGDTAAFFCQRKKSSLTVKEVFERMVKIRGFSGEGSQERKIAQLAKMLRDASFSEARYIMRIAVGKLRLGFGEQFLIEALAEAFTGNKKDARIIEDKYNVNTDIGAVAKSLASHGIKGIKRFSISLGRPVQAMLAKRVDTIEELSKRFPDEMAAEEKYDGERAQIHVKRSGKVQIFSRRLTEITSQFPDIMKYVDRALKADKAVLDGEIVVFEKNGPGSFQQLMQRRRKYEVEKYKDKIPVVLYLFDLLYLDGRSLLKKAYQERRKLLEKSIRQNKKIKLANRKVSSDFKEIQDFFKNATDKGYEGIIVKSTQNDSIYQPGQRGFLWVKWKKEYAEGMRDTFDLVVVGMFYGKGRRKKMFGALLGAVRNRKNKSLETFTKVGSGFTDADFDEIEKRLVKTEKKPVELLVDEQMEPDEYVEPEMVIEVLGAEITTSPKHTAGREKSKKGYALRFPRFLHIREDKSPDQVTTVEEIEELYQAEQKGN